MDTNGYYFKVKCSISGLTGTLSSASPCLTRATVPSRGLDCTGNRARRPRPRRRRTRRRRPSYYGNRKIGRSFLLSLISACSRGPPLNGPHLHKVLTRYSDRRKGSPKWAVTRLGKCCRFYMHGSGSRATPRRLWHREDTKG